MLLGNASGNIRKLTDLGWTYARNWQPKLMRMDWYWHAWTVVAKSSVRMVGIRWHRVDNGRKCHHQHPQRQLEVDDLLIAHIHFTGGGRLPTAAGSRRFIDNPCWHTWTVVASGIISIDVLWLRFQTTLGHGSRGNGWYAMASEGQWWQASSSVLTHYGYVSFRRVLQFGQYWRL